MRGGGLRRRAGAGVRLTIGGLYVHRESGRVGELAATNVALSGAMRLVVRTGRADIEAAPEEFSPACCQCSGGGYVGETNDIPCAACGGRGW